MREGSLRLSGPACSLGGLLWSSGAVLNFTGAAPGSAAALLIGAVVLLLAGMFGFHALYAGGMGGVGEAGFVQGFIGLGMLGGGLVAEAFGLEAGRAASSFGFLILAFGLVLIGYSTFYNETLPRWNFYPFVVAVFIPLDLLFGGMYRGVDLGLSVLFGLSWAGLGYLLWTKERG
ncbi:hypothetical protein E0L93_10510 [Rubrobacter taiwanensis]|uniref:Uncharacterized protein n=1 Tax=Rubrobacter taiwanensis TaxID=185139 RepID=A0A4R1BG09_9ACTN|nr:hypothetical protein [Rubrobacter taiwanensis]TCJ16103.1 hypothetical protein E0L93_10510 [Rubrobacter taiwanensis]